MKCPTLHNWLLLLGPSLIFFKTQLLAPWHASHLSYTCPLCD